jgi:transcriptional regulator of acetoin/glycerol metabolism
LKRHAFNISKAARELGLTRASLYRRMEKYGF